MLYPDLKDGYWDSSFYSLKWTYKLNGVLQEKELSVGFVIRNASPFLWFEIPDDLLRKGPVDIQLQLRKDGKPEINPGDVVFESKTFRVK